MSQSLLSHLAVCGAILSPDRRYRYRLWRQWNATLPTLACCMLNPSTADADHDDATIRALTRIAQFNNYGGMVIVNLFGLRSREPAALRVTHDPVGPDNDTHIVAIGRQYGHVLCAWGIQGTLFRRDTDVLDLLLPVVRYLSCLGITQGGQPRHPLFLPEATPLQGYRRGLL